MCQAYFLKNHYSGQTCRLIFISLTEQSTQFSLDFGCITLHSAQIQNSPRLISRLSERNRKRDRLFFFFNLEIAFLIIPTVRDLFFMFWKMEKNLRVGS